ncbi:hypothetical protein HZA41_02105, partial [Candidatus Peregrinibacteria bacterium]|nr:hypothetical protein [Candidatus Peregrinibacteria bacterium]
MKTKIFSLGGMIVLLSGLLFWSWQTAIFAVSSSVTVTSLVTSTTTVKENSLTPVFKITFPGVETGETLSGVNVILNSSATGSAATSDVLEDNRVHSGGWQLWKDSSSGTAGTFERYTDEQVLLSSSSLNYGSNGAFTITPDTNVSLTSNDIFYVAIKTDDTGLPASTTFTVSLSGITTTGSTQPSITTVQTSNLSLSVTPRLTKIELLDGGVSAGNRIRMTFNQSMDFSYITTYGLSWYIYQYDANWYQLSFGSSPTTAVSSGGGATNDTLTITLGTSPTITTDRPFYYSLPSAGTSYNWAYGQKRFDNTAPTLIKAELITDALGNGQAKDIGDQIAFQFSEAMDMTSATPNNVSAMLPPSSGSYSDSGAKPVLTWWGSSVLVVTLKNNLSTDLIGKTVNPANSLTDTSGNADNTSTAPTITATSLAPVASVTLSDIDTANSWLDKNDIGVDYVLPSYSSGVTSDTDFHVDLYLIPESVGFNFSSLYRINSAELTTSTAGTTQSFDGADSTYYLYYDSRTNFPSIANNDWSNIEYNSIEEGTRYIAYAVASTDPQSSETNAGRSIPKPSEPAAFTAESYSDTTSQPWVTSYSPNSSSVPTNTSSFTMTFSEGLDSTTASDIDNYNLKYDSDGNWTYDTEVPLTSVSYNSTTYTVTLTTSTALAASSWHYLQAESTIEDL